MESREIRKDQGRVCRGGYCPPEGDGAPGFDAVLTPRTPSACSLTIIPHAARRTCHKRDAHTGSGRTRRGLFRRTSAADVDAEHSLEQPSQGCRYPPTIT